MGIICNFKNFFWIFFGSIPFREAAKIVQILVVRTYFDWKEENEEKIGFVRAHVIQKMSEWEGSETEERVDKVKRTSGREVCKTREDFHLQKKHVECNMYDEENTNWTMETLKSWNYKAVAGPQ